MEDILFFDYNEKSSILLIFFFNALVFTYLLLLKGITESKKDSKWLAAFIFLGALYIAPFMFGYAGWYSKKSYREFLFFVPFQQLFLIGPVFFFYVKTLVNNRFQFSRKDLVHFLPAIVYLVYSLIIFIIDKIILDEFYFYADGKDKDLAVWYQVTGLISMLFYLFISLRYYFDYRRLMVQEVSFADEIAFKWVKHFAIVFGLILLLRMLFFILNPEWWEFGRKFWYYLCFSILLFYISIAGYSNTIRKNINLDARLFPDILPPENDQIEKANNEKEETLELKKWKEKIDRLFEKEGIHRNPDLTLTDIAELLNTNRNIISKTINQEFGVNFNDFVNEKRAAAVIERLNDHEHMKSTLLGIALDCGFNSKTTFNRAFKKYTGKTPKQFISKNRL